MIRGAADAGTYYAAEVVYNAQPVHARTPAEIALAAEYSPPWIAPQWQSAGEAYEAAQDAAVLAGQANPNPAPFGAQGMAAVNAIAPAAASAIAAAAGSNIQPVSTSIPAWWWWVGGAAAALLLFSRE